MSRDSLINDPAVQKVDRACSRPGQTRSAGYYYTGVDSNSYARPGFLVPSRATRQAWDRAKIRLTASPGDPLAIAERNPTGPARLLTVSANGPIFAFPVNRISIVGNEELAGDRRRPGIGVENRGRISPGRLKAERACARAKRRAAFLRTREDAWSINIYSRDQGVHKYLFEHRELL